MDKNVLSITDNFGINFLNTQIKTRGKILDLINDNEDIVEWINLQKELINDDELRLQLNVLLENIPPIEQIKIFREEIHEKVNKSIEGNFPIEQWKLYLDQELEQLPLYLQFNDSSGALLPVKHGFEGFKTIVLLQISKLMTNDLIHKIKHCANPNCILVFLDKSGKRKWCSMKICGNRNKVAQHKTRHSHEN
ncbi:CGNR zinc finger domain-containing protein [Enterococcus faecalis]|uniref:CGNR zinc finger domain-containing protein n=1 Tax=Enterococcus faecalis TaxID=1351 RepID=UPI002DB93E7E|nr:CGNR zinc finger domain-containing protein [Enterococcus faecalis]MEB7792170.1 CGNR zinc finger domain-containing protein [Enterococcus faecalis]MEB7810186.1 CGNR zinc finger domain-containing protein [Enterococcus faecalis]